MIYFIIAIFTILCFITHFRVDEAHRMFAFVYWLSHANLLHLSINMICLFRISKVMEAKLYFPIFIVGCIIPALIYPINLPTCGCSAGIFALYSFYFSNNGKEKAFVPMLFSIGVMGIFTSFATGLHIGGITIGILIHYIYERIKNNEGNANNRTI